MTVLAYDGKTLATDSRASSDNTITSDKYQKLYQLDGVEYLGDQLLAVAMAGSLSDFDLVLSYLTGKDFPANHFKHDTESIIMGRDYVYFMEHNKGFLIRYDKSSKLSGGSGHLVALTAMRMGMTAVQAVKQAIKMDMSCGGRVQHLER